MDSNQKLSVDFLIIRFQDIKKEMARNLCGRPRRSSEKKAGLVT